MAGVVRDYARAIEGEGRKDGTERGSGRAGRAAGKGGVEQEEGYRRAARGCVGSVIDLQQGVSLARSLLLSRSLALFPLSDPVVPRLPRVRTRSVFSLPPSFPLPFLLPPVDPSVRFLSLALFSVPPSLPFLLSVSFSQSASAGAIVRALLPFRLSSLFPSLIRSRRFRLPSSSRRSESNRL